jgi:hypothetical protein
LLSIVWGVAAFGAIDNSDLYLCLSAILFSTCFLCVSFENLLKNGEV